MTEKKEKKLTSDILKKLQHINALADKVQKRDQERDQLKADILAILGALEIPRGKMRTIESKLKRI